MPSLFLTKPWGFVIYRTVYTAESDLLWNFVITKIHAHVNREIWKSLYHPRLADPYPDMESFDYRVAAPEYINFKNIVIHDRELYNNASIDAIKEQFEDSLRTSDHTKLRRFNICRRLCLFVDEEVLWWLRDAANEPPLPTRPRGPMIWMKAIETNNMGMIYENNDPGITPEQEKEEEDAEDEDDDREGLDPRYNGWALVPVQLLAYLHRLIDSGDEPLGRLVSYETRLVGNVLTFNG